MDALVEVSYNGAMSERLKRLLAEARAWCLQERGRQSRLVTFLGVPRQTVSAWFAENPKKHPTAEQALAIQEFLKAQKKKKDSL
jgi:hypothetical protein